MPEAPVPKKKQLRERKQNVTVEKRKLVREEGRPGQTENHQTRGQNRCSVRSGAGFRSFDGHVNF